MRSKAWSLLLAIAVSGGSVGGCDEADRPLRLMASPEEPAPRIAARLEQILETEGLEVEIVVGAGSFAHLDALRSGEADLAIAANSVPFQSDLAAIAPLYLGVLHVLTRAERSSPSLVEVLSGSRVYAGPSGGVAQQLLKWIAASVRFESAYTLVENPFEGVDVYFTVGGIIPEAGLAGLAGYRLFGLGGPDGAETGIPMDAILLRHPQLEPFTLPAGLYPSLSSDDVQSIAVPSLLVSRADLPSSTAYALAQAVFENSQEIRQISPLADRTLLASLSDDQLNFPLHEGVRRYRAREEPSFLERYAEVIGLNLSGSIALVSGLVALRRWRAQSRKDRLDDYYAKVIELRGALAAPQSEPSELRAALRKIQAEAFRLLIDEKVVANEAFSILQALVADVAREIDALSRGER